LLQGDEHSWVKVGLNAPLDPRKTRRNRIADIVIRKMKMTCPKIQFVGIPRVGW
jgi:hypothetical protein